MHRLADLRADNGATGLPPLWWAGFGAIMIAGLLGILVVRRRMDSYRPDGRRRRAPGRPNASGF